MVPWELLESAPVPGDSAMAELWRRGDEFSIRFDREEAMNSRLHGSEDALSEIGCGRIADRKHPHVLIGGLGLGFSLAAALSVLGKGAKVVVGELVPAIVGWNRSILADVAGRPLEDPRVSVREGDVGAIIRKSVDAFDAILLDVDNGPDSFLCRTNHGLYSERGLAATYRALRPKGVFGVWSVGPCRPFTQRLRRMGFQVEEVRVPIRKGRGGRKHLLWIATRRD
ncbi:MAG: spermidine synthase [Lentisphaerae bacterium]|jgi:spermidine synthase|nr:spermidine synthase [Lentisphaerota bacterium]MBT4822392.1 spermidine synthase [Lentisphaerota bacterium]MBT5608253.1 spermidine synthase [Lentisphaerota bacterium]MBT7061189.1 spermidine synthase [Lentisphaerota bacterium]MBT7846747.1 spermidine synthase [Lentisphaerota bacterium]